MEQQSMDDESTVTILSRLSPTNNNNNKNPYKVYQWKVTDGSHVRAGQSLVDLCPSDDSVFATNNNNNTTTTKHKRPNRKRRLKPETTTTTTKKDPPPNTAPPTSILTLRADVDGILRIGAPPPSTTDTTTTTSTTNGNATPPQQQQEAATMVFGYIEKCLHPTIVEGLCAVCGQKVTTTVNPTTDNHHSSVQSSNNINNNNNPSDTSTPTAATNLTVGNMTVQISRAQSQHLAQVQAASLRQLKKLSLVLDLDHTLVHATDDARAGLLRQEQHSVRSLLLAMPQQQPQPSRNNNNNILWFHQQHFCKLRPHVQEFLQMVMEYYQIHVYTAGTRQYAEQVLLVLCRHVVHSNYDQVDLDHLRRSYAQAERRLALGRQQKENGILSATTTKRERHEPEEQEGANNNDDTTRDHTTDNGTETATTTSTTTAGQKRKRTVTFGEAPATAMSDETTQADVNQLKTELEAAEQLERAALAMRQKLFGSRVVTRTDVGDLGRDVKSLKRIFPCGGTMAAVVDDREDVWANSEDMKYNPEGEPPQNLLSVRPYRWANFLGFADVNNASGVDRTGQKLNDETDVQLLWTADILKRLHERYYNSSVPTTVPDTLKAMRKEVLAGCVLVFSGLIPLNQQGLGRNAPLPPIVRYAKSLGATIDNTVTASTTHVVAAKDGTDKILAARRLKGCHVVRESWLMECVWSMSRRDESAHLLNGNGARGDAKLPASTRLASTTNDSIQVLPTATTTLSRDMQILADSTRDNSSSSDEDDEEFAASLESELMGDSQDTTS